MKILHRPLLCALLFAMSCMQVNAMSDINSNICAGAVANPELNDGPLQNPLKGFHIGFFETCCGGAPNENYFGNFMATVGYQNFTWAELEGPEDDDWNWDFVDRELSMRAGSKDKHVIVQLNAEWARGDIAGRTPQWFIDDLTSPTGSSRFEQNIDAERGYQSHKYDSDYYQEEVKEFIAEFINRFKDDPRIFIIQIGMIGYFGEFNVFPNDAEWLPEEIKDAFFEHYRDHMFGEVEENAEGKLVVVKPAPDGTGADSYNGYSALTQARYPAETSYNIPTDGVGYTNGWINVDGIPRIEGDPDNPGDGINDDDIGNKDFNDPIDQLVSEDGRKLWTYGPVGGEWPPNRFPPGYDPDNPNIENEGVVEEWTSFWGTDIGENFLKRGHYSFARPPQLDTISDILAAAPEPLEWSLVPEGWNFFIPNAKEVGDNYTASVGGNRFRKWHRMMGYNYQLSNIRHAFSEDASEIRLEFDVNNIGLAPFYFDWDIQLAILDINDNVVQLIPVDSADMRDWLPETTTTVAVGAQAALDINGEYRIGLRMLQPGADAVKSEVWKLNPANTTVRISNDVDFIPGVWEDNSMNRLSGGWNILDDVDFASIGGICKTKDDLCFPVTASNESTAMVCF